ncbi:MAG: hypothetical protein ABIP53_09855 [Candidatus Limnocylindrales bacterium]
MIADEVAVALGGAEDEAATRDGEWLVADHARDRVVLESVQATGEVTNGRADIVEPVADVPQRVLTRLAWLGAHEQHVRRS